MHNQTTDPQVIVYGSSWCPHTIRMLQKLTTLGVPFRYVDVDEDPQDEQRIADWNHGRAIRPTLDINGDIFVAPGDELNDELRQRGFLA